MDVNYINVHNFKHFNLLQSLDPKAYDENTDVTKME